MSDNLHDDDFVVRRFCLVVKSVIAVYGLGACPD